MSFPLRVMAGTLAVLFLIWLNYPFEYEGEVAHLSSNFRCTGCGRNHYEEEWTRDNMTVNCDEDGFITLRSHTREDLSWFDEGNDDPPFGRRPSWQFKYHVTACQVFLPIEKVRFRRTHSGFWYGLRRVG